jgi:hypothetical protein
MGERIYRSTILVISARWMLSGQFTPLPLYRLERAPGTHCVGGWVGPRAGLDAVI